MGQYYYTVNLDKKQFLHPHCFGEGLKLMEFGCDGMGTMLGLAVLLADGNGRGGGDLNSDNRCPDEIWDLVGSWAGDRIVVAGDYADGGSFLEKSGFSQEQLQDAANEMFTEGYQDVDKVNVYCVCNAGLFEDISSKVIQVLLCDPYVREVYQKPRYERDPDSWVVDPEATPADTLVKIDFGKWGIEGKNYENDT